MPVNSSRHRSHPGLSVADIAASEYRRRSAKADQLLADRRLSREQANQLLRPWAAIVLLAGGELSPQLEDDLAELREQYLHPVAGIDRSIDEKEARALLADRICMGRPGEPKILWRAALAAAVRKAFNDVPHGEIAPGSDDEHKAEAFKALRRLAAHFEVFVDLPFRGDATERRAA